MQSPRVDLSQNGNGLRPAVDRSWVPKAEASDHLLNGAISNAYGHADGFYGDQHASNGAGRNLGAGLVPTVDASQYVMGDHHGNANDDYYSRQHAGKDVAGNLGAGCVPTVHASQHKIGNPHSYIDGVFVGQHPGKEYVSGSGVGHLPRADPSHGMGNGRRNVDDSHMRRHARMGMAHPGPQFWGPHAGKDTAGHLGTGMLPRVDASQFVILGDAQGSHDGRTGQHAGRMVAGHLGAGCVPTVNPSHYAVGNANNLWDDLYGGFPSGSNAASGSVPGSVPPFGVIGDLPDPRHQLHAGKNVASHLGAGLVPTDPPQYAVGNANNLWDDLYGGVHNGALHNGKHVASGRGHGVPPPFEVADTQPDPGSPRPWPSSNDWAVHHCPWQQK